MIFRVCDIERTTIPATLWDPMSHRRRYVMSHMKSFDLQMEFVDYVYRIPMNVKFWTISVYVLRYTDSKASAC